MKWISFILTLVILLLVIALVAKPGSQLACTGFGYLNSVMMNSNVLEVDPKLEKKLSIDWISPTTSEKHEIYRHGHQIIEIPNEYGLNTLNVSIGGKVHITKQHIKENWWHGHIYQVKGSADNIIVQITGCNGA